MKGESLQSLSSLEKYSSPSKKTLVLDLDESNDMYYIIIKSNGDNPSASFFVHNSVKEVTYR